MKKVTLLAIIIFVTIVGFIFVFSKDDGSNNENVNISQTSKKQKSGSSWYVTPVKSKTTDSQKTIGNNTETSPTIEPSHKNEIKTDKPKYLRSPNINIIALKKNLVQQQSGSSFSITDVSRHATLQDCYLAINGNVYDVTSYIPYHPAGSRIIERYCGQEVTGIFAQIHSNRAWDLLSRYKIGVISAHTYNIMPDVLSAIAESLQVENPSAVVMKVSPKHGIYLAKVIFDNKFYEVHMDESGKIIKEEIAENENWDKWEVDVDDNSGKFTNSGNE